jgi:hypothetical protein
MHDRRTGQPQCGSARLLRSIGVLSLVLACVLRARGASGQGLQLSPVDSHTPGTFQVTVSEGTLSLAATDASVVAIFQEIGRQANLTVENPPGLDKTITLTFERLPLEEGLKRITENIAIFYAKDSQEQAPRIVRVVLHSVGSPGMPNVATDRTRQPATPRGAAPPEPFKFEFDPSQYEKK